MAAICSFDTSQIPLNSIDLARLVPVRQVLRHYGAQDHSRWVLRGRLDGIEEPVFVKIWNPTYVRRDTLPGAIRAGFYAPDSTPALRGVVMSNGLCRGYVMAVCRRRLRLSTRFFRHICQRTLDSGFFAVQFSPAHAMCLRGAWSMIDLEGVYPLERLDLVAAHHSAFAYRPYAAFVARHLAAERPPIEPTRPFLDRLARRAITTVIPNRTKDVFNRNLITP